MADKDDLLHLRSGSKDLVRCDLREADLRGFTLDECDFSNASLQRTNFAYSSLRFARFEAARLSGAIMHGCDLTGATFGGSVFGVDFSGANLTASNFSRSSRLAGAASLDGASLVGADLSGVTIDEGCSLNDLVVDRTTNFHGLKLPRALSKNPAFSDYDYSRGQLHRKDDLGPSDERFAQSRALISELQSGLVALEQINRFEAGSDKPPAIGHNNPPENFVIAEQEYLEAKQALTDSIAALREQNYESSALKTAGEISSNLATKAASWVGSVINVTAQEFGKSLGQSLGSKTALWIATLQFSGIFSKISELIQSIIVP
jgi:hypothetical protein